MPGGLSNSCCADISVITLISPSNPTSVIFLAEAHRYYHRGALGFQLVVFDGETDKGVQLVLGVWLEPHKYSSGMQLEFELCLYLLLR